MTFKSEVAIKSLGRPGNEAILSMYPDVVSLQVSPGFYIAASEPGEAWE